MLLNKDHFAKFIDNMGCTERLTFLMVLYWLLKG